MARNEAHSRRVEAMVAVRFLVLLEQNGRESLLSNNPRSCAFPKERKQKTNISFIGKNNKKNTNGLYNLYLLAIDIM